MIGSPNAFALENGRSPGHDAHAYFLLSYGYFDLRGEMFEIVGEIITRDVSFENDPWIDGQ
jgi:hypothetical protein